MKANFFEDIVTFSIYDRKYIFYFYCKIYTGKLMQDTDNCSLERKKKIKLAVYNFAFHMLI